jgi:hypothetical protein
MKGSVCYTPEKVTRGFNIGPDREERQDKTDQESEKKTRTAQDA